MSQRHFHISDTAKTIIGIGTFIIAGLMAREGALEGIELFEGLGPVHRVLDREYGNSIAFETWPSALPGGDDLFSMVKSGAVKIRIDQRYALKDAAQAHRDLEARKTTGCSVLLP